VQQLSLQAFLADGDHFGFSGISFLEPLVLEGIPWLLAGSAASGAITSFRLQEGARAQATATSWISSGDTITTLGTGLCIQLQDELRLLSLERPGGQITTHEITPSGATTGPAPLADTSGNAVWSTALTSLTVAGQTYLAGTGSGGTGITLYTLGADWRVSSTATAANTPKSGADGLSDLLSVTVADQSFLISASTSESSLTSYQINAGGGLEFVDVITPADGLWVSGLDDITPLSQGGQSFVVGVSANAGALVSVRVNPMGVFFVSDIAHDNLQTRFDGAISLDTFEAAGRSFIVTGGADDGLSLFELLPGGVLFHHHSLAQNADWSIGAILSISTVVLGDEVQIMASGDTLGGIVQFALPLDRLGTSYIGSGAANTLTGSAMDDLMLGYSGNDTLDGGAGDDILIAGTGQDVLQGGAGADVFVFTADGQADRITDFELGVDRIHLDGWGRIYDISTLEISRQSSGARIRWGDETLNIETADGQSITSASWSADDFIF
jgi:serralysin